MSLASPKIAKIISDECGVKISYDEYHSSKECLKATHDINYYDIVIFPNDIYELITGKVRRKDSTLSRAVNGYSDWIKRHYLAYNYPSNIVYFSLSLSGFVWNPSNFRLAAQDSIWTMFEKAKNKVVILDNNQVGVWYLLDNTQKLPIGSLADVFEKHIVDVDIYVASGYNRLYDKDNFAFSYQRSGEALSIIKMVKNNKSKELAFFIHPKYSYVLPDMLAELNSRTETVCVAKVLASKRVLDIVQKETFYLSPYETLKSLVREPMLQNVYSQVFSRAPKMPWLDPFFGKSLKKYGALQNLWHKIHSIPQVMQNHTVVLKRKLH